VKPIDSVLRIMVEQGATDLRLESDRRPLMLKGDVELPLTIPATSTETIHGLLDDLWTAEGAKLKEQGRLSIPYRSAELGNFAVTLVQLEGSGLQAVFRRGEVEAGREREQSPPPRAVSPRAPDVDGRRSERHAPDAAPPSLPAPPLGEAGLT